MYCKMWVQWFKAWMAEECCATDLIAYQFNAVLFHSSEPSCCFDTPHFNYMVEILLFLCVYPVEENLWSDSRTSLLFLCWPLLVQVGTLLYAVDYMYSWLSRTCIWPNYLAVHIFWTTTLLPVELSYQWDNDFSTSRAMETSQTYMIVVSGLVIHLISGQGVIQDMQRCIVHTVS